MKRHARVLGVDNAAVPTSNGEDSAELGMQVLCYLAFSASANLIAQVNTFPLDSKVESLTELSDGFVLSKMLGECRTGTLLSFPPSRPYTEIGLL